MDIPSPAGTPRWPRAAARVAAAGVAVVTVLAAYGFLVEPRLLLDVREERVLLEGLPPAWRGARVALVADLQVGMWGENRGMMERVVERIVRDRPDVVLIAGDLIYRPGEDPSDELRRALGVLLPLAGVERRVFAVLGHHDWAVSRPGDAVDPEAGGAVERGLEDVGITVLRNEAVAVRPPGGADEPLWVVGLGSRWAGRDRPTAALAAVPAGAPRIVFMHHPDSFEDLPPGGAPLALAAHTHGGQVRIPFLRSRMTSTDGDHVRRDGWVDGGDPAGETAVGRTRARGASGNRLYVNRGIGFSALPVRIGSRPELTYFVLEGPGGEGTGAGLRGGTPEADPGGGTPEAGVR